MSLRFRPCSLDQPFLLPPSLDEWLPPGHLARFIAEVTNELDLSAIYKEYERGDGRGAIGYHPMLLTRLLLYAYTVGITSSRRIEKATYDDLALRYLAADQHPDHDTIAAFRQQHLSQLGGLFSQALGLCRRAGLVKLGNIALDGTKILANASRDKSMTYSRMTVQEQQLDALVKQLLEQAEATDRAEDERYGKGRSGDELPPDLVDATSRLEKLRAAKRELEREAAEQLERAQRDYPSKGRGGRPGKDQVPRKPLTETERHRLKNRLRRARRNAEQPGRQYNFSDPDSRLMHDNGKGAFVQGYNAQAAVDGHAQVIVAAEVTQDVVDRNQLVPMCTEIQRTLGEFPPLVTADAGYWNTEALAEVSHQGVDLLVAPDATHRWATPRSCKVSPEALEMRARIKDGPGRELYSRRREIVEPVFGQIKGVRRLDRFSMRGLDKVKAEWRLICATHNLLKLFRHNFLLQPA
jgi:transposase